MSNTPILEGIRKQNPSLLGSGKFVAIAECLMCVPMDKRSTRDRIEAICVDGSGMTLAMMFGDFGYNTIIGDYRDVEHNVRELAKFHGAPETEAQFMLGQVRKAGVNT